MAALVVGLIVDRLPEWAQLVAGVPLILAAYGAVIWYRGFGEEDRVLFSFARTSGNPPPDAATVAPAPVAS